MNALRHALSAAWAGVLDVTTRSVVGAVGHDSQGHQAINPQEPGHELTHDWTQDLEVTTDYASGPEDSAHIAQTEMGLLRHVVAVGTIVHECVFYFHPRVRRVATVQEWLAEVESHVVG